MQKRRQKAALAGRAANRQRVRRREAFGVRGACSRFLTIRRPAAAPASWTHSLRFAPQFIPTLPAAGEARPPAPPRRTSARRGAADEIAASTRGLIGLDEVLPGQPKENQRGIELRFIRRVWPLSSPRRPAPGWSHSHAVHKRCSRGAHQMHQRCTRAGLLCISGASGVHLGYTARDQGEPPWVGAERPPDVPVAAIARAVVS
jgi:hypothetical protein